jgi:hypothetical protein
VKLEILINGVGKRYAALFEMIVVEEVWGEP